MPWTVYCHTHIESDRRYVGLTKYTMMHRWNQHCAQAKRSDDGRSYFQNAIRKYGKDAFSHEILETCETLEAANLAEERWVAELGTRDQKKGFNLSPGGNHVPCKPGRKNPWDDPVFREKNVSAVRASVLRPEVKATRSRNSRRLWSDPSFRKKVTAAVVDSIRTPEIRKKISQGLTGRKLPPETLKKMSEANLGKVHSPEHLAKMSASAKRKWEDPDFRSRVTTSLAARLMDPDVRAEIRARALLREPRVHSMETKAKIAESIRAHFAARRG
jgi:hypothetical protein